VRGISPPELYGIHGERRKSPTQGSGSPFTRPRWRRLRRKGRQRPPAIEPPGQRTTCPRVPQEMPRSFEACCNRPQRLTARLLNGGREIHCPVTRPFLYGSPTGCSCLSRQARLWSTDASKIEPGQGGGRLMGLDGHPAPPTPGRPMLRKPRRVPPRWGFPFGCEAGTVQPTCPCGPALWTGKPLPAGDNRSHICSRDWRFLDAKSQDSINTFIGMLRREFGGLG
jgi:hypothetical protein